MRLCYMITCFWMKKKKILRQQELMQLWQIALKMSFIILQKFCFAVVHWQKQSSFCLPDITKYEESRTWLDVLVYEECPDFVGHSQLHALTSNFCLAFQRILETLSWLRQTRRELHHSITSTYHCPTCYLSTGRYIQEEEGEELF